MELNTINIYYRPSSYEVDSGSGTTRPIRSRQWYRSSTEHTAIIMAQETMVMTVANGKKLDAAHNNVNKHRRIFHISLGDLEGQDYKGGTDVDLSKILGGQAKILGAEGGKK